MVIPPPSPLSRYIFLSVNIFITYANASSLSGIFTNNSSIKYGSLSTLKHASTDTYSLYSRDISLSSICSFETLLISTNIPSLSRYSLIFTLSSYTSTSNQFSRKTFQAYIKAASLIDKLPETFDYNQKQNKVRNILYKMSTKKSNLLRMLVLIDSLNGLLSSN